MFTEQSKCTLTAEEQEFLEKAHLDVSEEEADDRASEDVSGDDDNSGFSAGQYNLKLDWCDTAKAVYTVGQAVYFYRAPNLGGADSVAALGFAGSRAALPTDYLQKNPIASSCTL